MGQQFGLAFDEIGTSQRRNTEVRLTHLWRGPDSNFWSLKSTLLGGVNAGRRGGAYPSSLFSKRTPHKSGLRHADALALRYRRLPMEKITRLNARFRYLRAVSMRGMMQRGLRCYRHDTDEGSRNPKTSTPPSSPVGSPDLREDSMQ